MKIWQFVTTPAKDLRGTCSGVCKAGRPRHETRLPIICPRDMLATEYVCESVSASDIYPKTSTVIFSNSDEAYKPVSS